MKIKYSSDARDQLKQIRKSIGKKGGDGVKVPHDTVLEELGRADQIGEPDRNLAMLDIYANIVYLCPICHCLLHYGVDSEKRRYLRQNIL